VILVFGANGQLGQELSRAAAGRGIALRGLPRRAVDIAEQNDVAAAFARWAPQLVVNAAAYTKVDLAETHEAEARRSNEIGPAVLAEECARKRIPLLHLSTDYVFDGNKQEAYREADPVCPISVYGRSKAAGEDAVRRGLRQHLILRTAWVYSEFGSNFLKTMLNLAQTRDELRIVDDQYGSPTSAADLADVILRIAPILLRDEQLAGTYHFTADGFTTWHGFASRAVAIAAPIIGRHSRVTPIGTADYPTAAKRPINSRLDCRLFTQTFGFSPRHWTEGVDATARKLAAAARQAESHVA
jgi:dTDP-4-dehydrorhamnose reductase